MGIEHGICSSFLLELAQGIHVFPTDTLKMALYTSDAEIGPSSTAYTTTGEITVYTAGGENLSFTATYPKLSEGKLLFDFADVTYSLTSISEVAGAMIYNSSKANRAIGVLDFGQAYFPAVGNFVVVWPTPDIMSAIIRAQGG